MFFVILSFCLVEFDFNIIFLAICQSSKVLKKCSKSAQDKLDRTNCFNLCVFELFL